MFLVYTVVTDMRILNPISLLQSNQMRQCWNDKRTIPLFVWQLLGSLTISINKRATTQCVHLVAQQVSHTLPPNPYHEGREDERETNERTNESGRMIDEHKSANEVYLLDESGQASEQKTRRTNGTSGKATRFGRLADTVTEAAHRHRFWETHTETVWSELACLLAFAI